MENTTERTPDLKNIKKVKTNITEFCFIAQKSLKNNNGIDFLKDFTETLYKKKKTKNSDGANLAYKLLKNACNHKQARNNKPQFKKG